MSFKSLLSLEEVMSLNSVNNSHENPFNDTLKNVPYSQYYYIYFTSKHKTKIDPEDNLSQENRPNMNHSGNNNEN